MGRLTHILCRASIVLARLFCAGVSPRAAGGVTGGGTGMCRGAMTGLRRGCVILMLLAAPLAAQNANDAGDVPPEPGLPTPNEVLADVDKGIKLAQQGDMTAAYEILDRVNQITYEHDYPGLSKHYPNLGLAYYNYEQRDWSEVLRFSASVATGLSSDGFPDHPYRIAASALQGAALRMQVRLPEAEIILRNAVAESRGRPELAGIHGLAFYHLGMAVTDLDRDDRDKITSAFLNEWSSDWLVSLEEALILNYRDIVNDKRRQGDMPRAIRRTRNLVAATAAAEDIDLRRVAGFRGYLGVLMAESGEWDTALGYLQQEYDYYRDVGITGTDLNENILYLGQVLRYGRDPQEGYQFFENEIALARQTGAEPVYIARFLTQQAHIAKFLEDIDDAQRLYREAYAEVRSVDRANHWVARGVRKYIDLDHPGMKDFAFASELGAIDAVQFDLAPDGADVLRLFFEGNYLALDAVLARFEDEGRSETIEYQLNRALYLAVIGKYHESLTLLDRARRTARTTNGGGVAANALIFDQIEVIAKVWGTGHEPETAQGALDRMRARLPNMTDGERSLYHALLAFKHFRLSHYAEMQAILEIWFAEYGRTRTTGIWDIYAATVIMEMSFGNMDEALNEALLADTLSALKTYPTMTLARDYLRLVKVLNSRKGIFSDEAMVELGTLVASIGGSVPRDHSMLAATQFGLANAHGWRGNREESLHWLRETAATLRASPYFREDVNSFLLARQSRMLRELGRVDEAHSIAQEALKAIDPRTARLDLIGEIYQNTALALKDRTNNDHKVVAFLDTVLDDPEVFARFTPMDQVGLLRIKADSLANYAELSEILATLDRAALVMEDSDLDWRLQQSSLYWSRAIANYWNDATGEGLLDMMYSNDIYVEWLASIRASSGAEGVDPDGFRLRADWEALIGWDYAQTLPPDPQ
ncbi:hypothetical protein [Phaeobacter sp. J2-8]|uniref:hypothetical protein n=1 Tax=Phaeobacter sp. J2-8 TaxID=2931394 RepID=UPI001FD34639|nr:hypothetical protein [Phaeobacter sp. J2-8]MCJ7874891.1 hypothetical protein [Phaeobacter sp. J2-8]